MVTWYPYCFPPLFRRISQWPWHVPQSSSARGVNPIPMSWQPAEPLGVGLFRAELGRSMDGIWIDYDRLSGWWLSFTPLKNMMEFVRLDHH